MYCLFHAGRNPSRTIGAAKGGVIVTVTMQYAFHGHCNSRLVMADRGTYLTCQVLTTRTGSLS